MRALQRTRLEQARTGMLRPGQTDSPARDTLTEWQSGAERTALKRGRGRFSKT